MSVVWHIYWPLLVAALLGGIVVGRMAFRLPRMSDDAPADVSAALRNRYKRKRNKTLWLGLGGLLAAVALWHGPLGGGERFARLIEGAVAAELEWLEMPEISGKLERGPLSRRLVLAGPANDFQQEGFFRALKPTKGISGIRWADQRAPGFELPLLAEVTILSLIAFVMGLFFSFIVEIRRRVNAEWSW
jgi:hypothetical protein